MSIMGDNPEVWQTDISGEDYILLLMGGVLSGDSRILWKDTPKWKNNGSNLKLIVIKNEVSPVRKDGTLTPPFL